MRGDPTIVEFLNEHLTGELTIVNQYFLNSRMLHNWGLPALAQLFHSRSLEEMQDLVVLTDRILYYDGHPNLQRLDTVRIGESPQEMIEVALACEKEAIERLQRGVELAIEKHDAGTRDLLAGMLADEERHADDFEAQLEAIEQMGLQNYLALDATPGSA